MAPVQGESALALIGYSAAAARALREFGLVTLGVPAAPLPEVLSACEALGFAGALLHPSLQAQAAEQVQLDPDARRAGLTDALAFTGGPRGTYAAPEALLSAVQESSYAARGAHAVLIGSAADLRLGLGLARMGFKAITVVADSHREAEAMSRDLPAGLAAFALTRQDAALRGLAEKADFLVITGGTLPSHLVQPYHTVLDLSGKAGREVQRVGATLLSLPDFPARVLARQLEHATGQRFRPDLLAEVAATLVAEA
ncbi:shikimate dehydrogenase [Deinococcus psychrotolerans]|uniref:Shikimate dehydrogenase n=1 Tax=Deinococcus psychrotolerans TaxID=2489213 RepID=A0A3G8YAV9_9DEIO|nr:shikimate dehydrogenase [Deinococcus psychrotolerans]AZI42060.1 shikimate dehydrogenase [Deinococcus psychrotolerans]